MKKFAIEIARATSILNDQLVDGFSITIHRDGKMIEAYFGRTIDEAYGHVPEQPSYLDVKETAALDAMLGAFDIEMKHLGKFLLPVKIEVTL